MTVGERIKARRKELGLTQTELAERLHYKSKVAVSNVENNKEDLTTTRVKKYATALECTPEYLMGWATEKELHEHLRQTDIIFAKKKLDEIKKGIHDIPINKNLFRQTLNEKKISKEELSLSTGIDLSRIVQLVREKNSLVSWDELKLLNNYLNVNLVDYYQNITIGASVYNDIISELMCIENIDTYSDLEKDIINKYRSSDELTQAMVKRTLGIG